MQNTVYSIANLITFMLGVLLQYDAVFWLLSSLCCSYNLRLEFKCINIVWKYQSILLLRAITNMFILIFDLMTVYHLIVCSLHDVHELNTCRADHVCPSVCAFQLEDCWTDFDETCYGHYTIGGWPELILLNFLQLVIPTWQIHESVKLEWHYYHFIQGSEMIYGNRCSENMQFLWK
jgi:hypothetical protein